ncbi:phosphoribosylformylglycinamidine cyclo-ligase [Paucilactobacillus suebicus]|uniref:Phosphoribosylformylglycinamidine cyclo-ligase n=1 Tax=Paucilactobacillus suebicus DSM 5007 = KCTC 3549 TaxID=1423807 RepID=A0A0R1WBJ2_9LACO|nr:phosphoribosylformylglycinamidine cyclo-ligase [Paucilactobacillus suebicus]KRM12955.1 phosphoribosylformylglycinamidine cyclo-ligase [Paucilactobacillus suebicus DSM 5007 = KCTC 3549]
MKNAYEEAGVNIAAGEAVVDSLKQQMGKQDNHVLSGIGGFAGCYQLSEDQLTDAPVLVAGSDGVGTKVLLAAQANQVSTIGQDLVAMCVNDLLAQGAQPLFFLDYLALSELDEDQVNQILKGVLDACQNHQMTLLGGETAEMPCIYQEHHFDLAGFAIGLAKKNDLLTPGGAHKGDYLIGLPSSGLHSNGFSLVRKLLFSDNDYHFDEIVPSIGHPLIEELLKPTRIYTNVLKPLLNQKIIAGAAHITGGGLIENVPRMLGDQLQAEINIDTWPTAPIFKLLTDLGKLSVNDRYQTFNMGIGMVLAVHPDDLDSVTTELINQHEPYYHIGRITSRAKDQPAVQLVGVEDD